MIRYDYFQSVRHVSPVPQIKTYEDFAQMFVNFETAETKEYRFKSFSFTQYLPGLTRAKDNIEFMTGFVFDFDNKDCEPVSVQSVLDKLQEKMITYLWYHTYSHTKDQLRWRLVIPFGKLIKPDIWEETYNKGLQLIGNPPGIDPVSRKTAQLYFFPYQPKNSSTMFQAEAFHGYLLNPENLEAFHEVKKEIISIPVIDINAIIKSNEKYKDELDKVDEALKYISPDVEYSDWIKVGMALKSEFGEAGQGLWDNWSKRGLKYTSRKEIIYHWNTFNGSGTNIGSLYALAKERGFAIPGHTTETKRYIKTTFVEKDVTIYQEVEVDIVKDSISKLQEFRCRDIFDIPCDVVKDLYEWINQSGVIIQPIYSLATAISIMGFVKRQVIVSPTSLKTNLYTLAMGPSRSGKNNGVDCITKILDKLKLDKFLITNIGSHQGLLKEMNANKGFLYAVIDEIAYLFGSIQNKQAASHEKNIEQKLLSLYNCRYQTSDATKNEKLERVSNPFLHIYSTTTEQIVDILKSNSATSGLLARFLIFQVVPGMPFINNANPLDEIPETLLDSLAKFQKETFRKAVFDGDASHWFQKFSDKVRTLQQLLCKEGTKVDSLFGNLSEQAMKVALLTTPFRQEVPFGDNPYQILEKWPFIRLEDIQWGVAVALHCLQNNVYCLDSFADNPQEKIFKKICKKIQDKTKDGKWIIKSDLYKFINCEGGLHNFEGIIKHLLEAKLIDVEKNYKSRGFKIRWITAEIRKQMEEELKETRPRI